MLRTAIISFLLAMGALCSSEIPNFECLEKSQGAVIFLTTPKSGVNWVTGSLTAITRKPISWLHWGRRVLNPVDSCRTHPSYNRIGLPLITDRPLLYRTHRDFDQLRQLPSNKNKLIFLTRNPKELLFRKFFLTSTASVIEDPEFIRDFFERYLQAFEVYDSWDPDNRMMFYYEDFIERDEEILLRLLAFMGEEPAYLDDFRMNKQLYAAKLLDSYKHQHPIYWRI